LATSTTDARRTLATEFFADLVDYCNAVLCGTLTAVIRRLQMVLNATARLVVGLGKHEHITPVFATSSIGCQCLRGYRLKLLHWLLTAS